MYRPLLLLGAFALLLSAFVLATCTNGSDNSARHRQLMEMMKDSTMMQTMMNHVASDAQMRMAMMHTMVEGAKGDTLWITQVYQMLMDDKEMHRMMMNMMRQEAARQDSIGFMPEDKLKHENAHEHRHP